MTTRCESRFVAPRAGWYSFTQHIGRPPTPRRRLRVYIEPRDWWIGAYIARDAIYVCLLPTLVIRWSRRRASIRSRP